VKLYTCHRVAGGDHSSSRSPQYPVRILDVICYFPRRITPTMPGFAWLLIRFWAILFTRDSDLASISMPLFFSDKIPAFDSPTRTFGGLWRVTRRQSFPRRTPLVKFDYILPRSFSSRTFKPLGNLVNDNWNENYRDLLNDNETKNDQQHFRQ